MSEEERHKPDRSLTGRRILSTLRAASIELERLRRTGLGTAQSGSKIFSVYKSHNDPWELLLISSIHTHQVVVCEASWKGHAADHNVTEGV